jgi:hypothetical protein
VNKEFLSEGGGGGFAYPPWAIPLHTSGRGGGGEAREEEARGVDRESNRKHPKRKMQMFV